MAGDTSSFDVAGFMQEANKQSGLIKDAVGQLTTMAKDSVAASDQLVQSILGGTDKAGDTAISKEAKLTGELQSQNKKQEFYAAIGMDADGQAKISNRLASEYNDLMEHANTQMQDIVAKKQVGLFDNPIEYIMNAITLPDDVNAMKATQAAATMKATQLQTINSLAQETAQTENAFKLTTSQAAVDSQLQGFKNDIQAQAAQAKIQAINSNAHTVVTVLEAQGKQLQNIKSVIEMRNSQAYLGMAQEAHGWQKSRFKEWVQETKDKNAVEAQMLDWYNQGAASMGREPVDAGKFKLLMASGMNKDAVQAYIEAGYMQSSFNTNALGVSPANVTATLSRTKNVIPERDKYAGDIFTQASQVTAQLEQQRKLDKKNPAAVTEAFNNSVKSIASGLQTDIKYSDKTNPYLVPPPQAWVDQAPDIVNSPFYQKVIKAQAIDTSDPKRLLAAGVEAVKSGQISPKDFATGYTAYYEKGVLANNAFRNFNRYALPEATKHTVQIEVPSGFGGSAMGGWNPFSRYDTVKVDVTDYSAVSKLLASYLTADIGATYNASGMKPEGWKGFYPPQFVTPQEKGVDINSMLKR